MTSRTVSDPKFVTSLAGIASLLVLACPMTALVAQNRPAMSAQDLVTMPRLGSPTASPDGSMAVFPVTTTDPESYQRTTALYVRSLAPDASGPVKIAALDGANSASFARDGWLYFLADGRDSASQVWRAHVKSDGSVSDKQQVSTFIKPVEGFSVSPTGDKIAVWADIARDCPGFGCRQDGTGELPGPGDGRLYKTGDGFVRHWDKWQSPGTVSRVFAYEIVEGRVAGKGVPLDGPVGPGALIGNTPTKPFGGGEDISWAPDGKSIYFVAKRADAKEPQSTDFDIWHADLSGGEPLNITVFNDATDMLPTPSPDGRYLAYVAMQRPGYESDRQVVQIRDLKTGATKALTENWDRSVGSLAWTADSRWLVATAQDTLDTPAFRIDPRTGTVVKLDLMAGNEAHIGNIVPLSGGGLLFTRDSIGAPSELYLSRDWHQAKPLSDVATTLIGKLAGIVTTRFHFAGAGGDTVWGQITKPEHVTGQIPAILYVHGGPQGTFNDSWSSRWNPRVLASQGYAVISVDFHGSTGYGQAFTDSINQDWGGKPLVDLQLGLAAALADDPQIDGSRACAMGASYGGYMMNWIEGQWPGRFKCLVQHDGVFDARAMAYETDELWFDKWEHGGTFYFEDPEAYEKWNPANYVANWQTPMLVVTSQQDFRIPYTQGIAAFTALQMRNIPGELLVFPDENHWVLKPKNSLQWHQTVFKWLARWLKR
ncbi:MAG: S9 family peptidase [Sphingomonadaceae bacterium]